MHLILDMRTATHHFPGIGRYVYNLSRALISCLAPEDQLTLMRDPSRPSEWDLTALAGERVQLLDVPLSPFALAQQWTLPRLFRSHQADVYHSTYFLMPFWTSLPTVLTIHDLIPLRYPGYFPPLQRWVFLIALRLALHRAHKIITVSQATTRDLQRLLPIPTPRIVTIPEAADPHFRPLSVTEITPVRRRLGLPLRYVLYLGTNKPHKNLIRLIDAWHLLGSQVGDTHLVIAGREDPRYPQARQRAEERDMQNVVFLGAVAEQDLPALYGGAEAFVFPSLYEGVGLPVLEAMACGTPVLCSHVSSLPEVAGEAALLFDPDTPEAIAAAIQQVLNDEDLRASLRQRGLVQAQRFSWEQTAQQTYAVYCQVLHEQHRTQV